MIGTRISSTSFLIARWRESCGAPCKLPFNITPPNSVGTLFGTWLVGIEAKTARDIRVGVCALLWAIWNCRNDLAFKNNNYSFFAGFIPSYCADPYVVLTHSDGGQGSFGY